MTKTNEFIGQTSRTTATGAGAAYGAFGPVIQSAIGVVRESAGLVRNVGGLGIALVLDTKSAELKRLPAPRPLPAPSATNVIRFPLRPKIGRRNQRE